MGIVSNMCEVMRDSYVYKYSSPPPNQLILFVTSLCNFKCEICFYWEKLNDTKNDLSLEEIKEISSHFKDLKLLLLSGGEPFLREDLFEVIKVFYDINNVRKLHLPTNGYATEKTVAVTERILKELPGLKINMGISLDGLEEKHNLISQHKSAFDNAIETQRALVDLEKKYENLVSRFYCVVTNENVEETEKVFQFITDEFGFEKIGFSPLRGEPKEPSLEEPTSSDWDGIFEMYSKYKKNTPFSLRQYVINRKTAFINKIFSNEMSGKGLGPIECSAGDNICVIDSDGDVRVCELKKPVANLRDHDYNISSILKTKEKHTCSCTHACFLNASLEISPVTYVRSLLNL